MNETATLGGGCYWCLEAFYQRIKGIETVESGYSGGHLDNPTVDRVYDGDTGHAEVVHLTFDPKIISYREILEIFFVMHDPSTIDRQGNDVGDEYRSIILYESDEQKKIAEDMIATYAKELYSDPIVTEVIPLDKFWPAAEYMQDYYNKNPTAGYCMMVIDPKIQKLRQHYAERLK
jgi:peptide-methionine (S)-S-oxide reductase